MKLSIIVPAHNEEGRICGMLDSYLPYFSEKYGADVEFIVVVNGSTDNTEGLINRYKQTYPCVRMILEPKRIGKGGALMLGFRSAKGDLLGFVDADGSTPAESFQELVDNIGDNSAIIASRWIKGSKVSPKQKLSRRIASRSFNLITRYLFGLKLYDTQCGAKLIKADALRFVLPNLGITKWAFDVDLLFQLKRAGYSIKEIPTVWHDVDGSKISALATTSCEMAAALCRLRIIYSPFRFVVAMYDKILGPILHSQGEEQDYLLRHSLLLLSGSQVSNVFNLLFQMIMVRMLTSQGVAEQYGVMVSMLAIVLLVCAPVAALGRTVSHFSANLLRQGLNDAASALVKRFLSLTTIVVLLLSIVPLVLRHHIAHIFRLDSDLPVIVTIISIILISCNSMIQGSLIGIQAFVWSSGLGIIWSGVRLVAAVLLVFCGMGAVGALTANGVAMLLSMMIGLYAVLSIFRSKARVPVKLDALYAYFFKHALALTGYAILASADVVIAKICFSPEQAGSFAVAAMPARIMYFLSMPIVTAMFPKVSSEGTSSVSSRRILFKTVFFVVLIVFTVAFFTSLFPRFVLQLLAHVNSDSLIPLVRVMVWALSPLPVVCVVMNFELAQRRFMVTIPLLIGALIYIVGVVFLHSSLIQVVCVLGVATVVTMLLSIGVLLKGLSCVSE